MGAWDKFFCVCCQVERPLSEKVKHGGGHAVRCISCSQVASGKRKRGKPARVVYDEPEADNSVPAGIVEAWQEQRGYTSD